MSELCLAATPKIEVRIDNVTVGMTQSVETRVHTALTPVHAIGQCEPTALVRGKREYTVTLKRMVVDRAVFPSQLPVSELDDFSLTVSDGVLETTFTDCRVAKEISRYDVGGLFIEELEVCALGRAWANAE